MIYKILNWALTIFGIKQAFKYIVVSLIVGGLSLYILTSYPFNEIVLGLFIFLIFTATTIGVLATHSKKGDIQNIGYSFETGQEHARNDFEAREKTLKRGFI